MKVKIRWEELLESGVDPFSATDDEAAMIDLAYEDYCNRVAALSFAAMIAETEVETHEEQ